MTRVGNQTNSTDPHSVNSRIFVGNLNTYVVGKEEVERIFGRYGRVIGISMHKGYAFVQYTDAWDARNAVVGEDGRTVAGQLLDVNMVSEPKPHQVSRKRQIFNTTPAATPAFLGLSRQAIPPMKKQRTEVIGFPLGPRPLAKTPRISEKQQLSLNALYSNGEPDILICGNCKEVFPGIHKLIEHKKQGCKLRFSCRCQHGNGSTTPPPSRGGPSRPVCAKCQSKQSSWWDLVQHFQTVHGSAIYVKEDSSSSISNNSNNMDCEETGAHSQCSGETTTSGSSLGVEVNHHHMKPEDDEEEEGAEDDCSNSTSDSRTGMPEFEIFEASNGTTGLNLGDGTESKIVDSINQVAEDKAVDTTDLQTLPIGEG